MSDSSRSSIRDHQQHFLVLMCFILIHYIFRSCVSRGSTVGIPTAYRLDDRGIGVRVPVGSQFSLFHIVQTGSGAHPVSYQMGTGGSFLGGKAVGA
jgi:hypothetical protein